MKSWLCAVLALLEMVYGASPLSCQDRGIRMTESFTAKDDIGCVLQVWMNRVGTEELDISYIFTNGSTRNAYIFNKLYTMYSDQDQYLTDPHLVNVEVDNGKVLVSKTIVKVPAGTKVEQPNIPCVTKVPAGSNFQEIIRLRLPLKPWTPYSNDEISLQTQLADKRLRFTLGYFLSTPEGDNLVRTVQTGNGPALRFYPFSFSSQKILEVGPPSFPVPVILPKAP
jgi:hypothetical protein